MGRAIHTDINLMWREGYKANSHDVYFGTSLASLKKVKNQRTNIFIPAAPLTPGQTYYWRVDAVTSTDTIEGDVWQFPLDVLPESTVIYPVADAYVDDKKTDTNFGSSPVIKLTTPVISGGEYEQQYGFIQFDINVPGTITAATFRVYNHHENSLNRFVNVHPVLDNNWQEHTITWANQPAMETALPDELHILAKTWS